MPIREVSIHADFNSVPTKTIGTPPIPITPNVDCIECGQKHDYEACPLCGDWIQWRYGLMFGGIGRYAYCQNDDCEWFYKELDGEE